MPDIAPPDPFGDRKVPGGIYADCFDAFSRDSDSMSQLDYYADFIGETNPWPPNRFATQFIRPSNPDRELVVTFFGEVLSPLDGTGLGARGGSALKRNQPEDDLKIRDVIALGTPTGANQELDDLFADQITTLCQVVKELPLPGDKTIPKRVQFLRYKAGSIEPTIISANLPYKYSRPNTSGTPSKLQKRASDADVSNSKSNKIALRSTYEPEKMFDFDSRLRLGGARLLQQPLYDQNSELVPPWEAPLVFRTGALVAVEACISVYHFVEDTNPSHLYQLAASRIKLLDPSPLPYQPIAPPPPRKKMADSRSAMFDRMLSTTPHAKE